jgi:putative flavoprotein involved in K+ transport
MSKAKAAQGPDGEGSIPSHVEAAVIGAGPAGLGAAAALRRRKIEAVVLERARIGESWHRRYDGLRLNTVRWMSGLPGMRIPRNTGRWPSRDQFIRYLESYAAEQELDVRSGVTVERVERVDDGYILYTSAGEVQARFAVVAIGYDRAPYVPDWPGRDGFRGELIHASDYRSPERFRGKSVLVIGLGNTGCELAVDLLRGAAASVRVSMRTPPTFARRDMFGLPATVLARLSELQPDGLTDRAGFLFQRLLCGNLEPYGLPRAPLGMATQLRVHGVGPTVDSGFVSALKQRKLELVPQVKRFEGPVVVLGGGARIDPEVVIAATGYRHGLEPLLGHLGVLSPSGRPVALGGETAPNAPGLHFNGYWFPFRGQLPAMRKSSREIARAIARQRRRGSGARGSLSRLMTARPLRSVSSP